MMIAVSTSLMLLATVAIAIVIVINRNAHVEESDRIRAERIVHDLAEVTAQDANHSFGHSSIVEHITSLATEAGIDAKASQVTAAFLAVAILAFMAGVFAVGPLFGISCALCAPPLCILGLRLKSSSRAKTFDRQFASALLMVAQSMSSGMTAEAAFSSIARYVSNPLKGELIRMSSELRYGRIPLEIALNRLAARTGSDDAAFLATAVGVQKIGGGSLADVLRSTAQKIDARIRLRGLVDSVTSSARWTSKVIATLPFFVLAALVLGVPDIGKTFWESPAWPLVVAAIAILVFLGLVVMRRMYKMKLD